MRCLALAQAWQDAGGTAVFAMAESTPSVDARLRAEGMEIVGLKASPNSVQDAQDVAAVARDRSAAWVVVDGYQFDSGYQRNLKNAGLKLLLVDDLGQCGHYFADLVLDQNVHTTDEIYANRESYTRLLLGPDYALLRREFHARGDWRRNIPAIGRKVLITMGGSDPDNLTLRLVGALNKISIPNLEITVVAGGSNPQLPELQRTLAGLKAPIRLVRNPSNMPEIMDDSDIAIICAGGTLWELLYAGCATFSYFRTPTQGQIVAELDAMGAIRSMGAAADFQPNRLACPLEEMMACRDGREKMAHLGRKLVDGKGASRVLGHILPESMNVAGLRMIPVKAEEREEFMEMAQQHFRELNPGFSPEQDWKNSYFDNIKSNPKYALRWIDADGRRVGFILSGVEAHRFLPRQTGAIYEVYVVPEERRKGIARACAKQVIEELWKESASKIQLEVVEGNAEAAELWRSLGFEKVTERFVLTEPAR